MDDPIYCSRCNTEIIDESEECWMDDEILCEDCYDTLTVSCSRCNERVWNRANAGNDDNPLCGECYDNHYTHCSNCERLIHNDSAYYADDDYDNDAPRCYHCHEQHMSMSGAYLHSYGYKPSPIFHGDSSRYFGVELEIDGAGRSKFNAEQLTRLANRTGENVYIKTDSSLNDGLEIVTHPMSLSYHLESMPWESLLSEAVELDYKSHMADTCGLHVHVNRNSFSKSYDYQEECIARVLYIMERFWEEFLRFSRRTPAQLKRWASRYGYKDRPEAILDIAKNPSVGRYTCVNLTNDYTIEFRIFRGTLKYNTLIATLQLVNEICEMAYRLSDETIKNLGWCEFMERISPSECPELIQYLKERRLYINEAIRCEAEV